MKGYWARRSVLVFALVGCGEQPSKVEGAPASAPDESYQLESRTEEGFLWHCAAKERVRMFRSCSGQRCGKWTIARGPCGGPMPDEPPSFQRPPMTGAGWW